jgi:hypothetical protein
MKTRTKGNIIIEELEVGDITYEFEYGRCSVCKVITKPKLIDDEYYKWKAKDIHTGEIINYGQNINASHYGLKLYDFPAYAGCKIEGTDRYTKLKRDKDE